MVKRTSSNKAPDRPRIAAEKRGRRAEFWAAMMLRLKGYRIVKMRYRTKQGEIDIIARKGDLVAMVEVKARKSVANALDAVTHTAQRRIINAGDTWLAQQHDFAKLSIRYDIVAIVPGHWPHHYKGAWEAK